MKKIELKDPTIKNAKPHAKPYLMADSKESGLHLRVSPGGVKSWQFRYSLHGKRQVATLGKYPAVNLAKAREKAQKARELAADGKHVTEARNVARAAAAVAGANTFRVVAADWIADEAKRRGWCAAHKATVEASLRNHLSKLDNMPVTAITALICDPELRRVETSAPDVGRKVRQRLRSILASAKRRGMIEVNPLADSMPGPKAASKHLPAELSHAGVGAILRNADQCAVSVGVRRAHMLLAYTAQRISEVVGAVWAEVDFDAATWTIPRSRMKLRDPQRGPHVVPLPPGLLAQMREWHSIDAGSASWVCPSPATGGHITREAVEKVYHTTWKLAGKHSPHSWRSCFSTWARDAGRDHGAIERHLDHHSGNAVQRAYDRAERLEIRREILKAHEQALIAARDGAQVIQLAQRRA